MLSLLGYKKCHFIIYLVCGVPRDKGHKRLKNTPPYLPLAPGAPPLCSAPLLAGCVPPLAALRIILVLRRRTNTKPSVIYSLLNKNRFNCLHSPLTPPPPPHPPLFQPLVFKPLVFCFCFFYPRRSAPFPTPASEQLLFFSLPAITPTLSLHFIVCVFSFSLSAGGPFHSIRAPRASLLLLWLITEAAAAARLSLGPSSTAVSANQRPYY